MKIENLEVGMTIKNYKVLCELLEIAPKGGISKQLQIKELERYCNYEKQGKKFIISEVFDVPKEKENLISKGNTSKYIEDIKDILIEYLYENRSYNAKVLLSFSKLINILGLVNNTYTLATTRKRELSDILNVELKAVYYFYNNTRSEFKNIVERALNNLQKRSVIFYNKKMMIVERTGKYDKTTERPILKYREALPEEISMILDAQKEALEFLGFEDFQGLFLAGSTKYKEFMNIVKKELPKEWQFFFNVYELIVGEKAIKIEHNHMIKRRINLNEKSIERTTTLLKVVNKYNPEQLLIDKLLNLNSYDITLDDEILELSRNRELEKRNKINKNNEALLEIESKRIQLDEDILAIKNTYENRDAISKYDYYKYSHQVKERSNIEDTNFDDDNYSDLLEMLEDIF